MTSLLRTTASTLNRDAQRACGLQFNTSPVPMWVFEHNTLSFLAVNDAAISQYGFSREQFRRLTILDVRPSDEVPRLLRVILPPLWHDPRGEVWRHRNKTGHVFDVRLRSYNLLFEGRRAELILAYHAAALASDDGAYSAIARPNLIELDEWR